MAHKLSIQKMVYCIPGQLSHIMFDCLTFRLRTSISPIKGNFNLVPSCEQRLHFRSVSWHVKSSPCRQLFKFSIVHAQNSSRDWQAKLIIRSVIKWHEFCGNKKKLQQLWSAMQDSCNALNWSRTGKSPFFKFIRPDFWMDLNGCWQRLLFARQLTQRKFSLCSSGTRSLAHETEGKIWSNKKIQFFWFARLWTNDVSVVSYTCYGVCNSFFVKSSVLFK